MHTHNVFKPPNEFWVTTSSEELLMLIERKVEYNYFPSLEF